jgi:hypothetical protein
MVMLSDETLVTFLHAGKPRTKQKIKMPTTAVHFLISSPTEEAMFDYQEITVFLSLTQQYK